MGSPVGSRAMVPVGVELVYRTGLSTWNPLVTHPERDFVSIEHDLAAQEEVDMIKALFPGGGGPATHILTLLGLQVIDQLCTTAQLQALIDVGPGFFNVHPQAHSAKDQLNTQIAQVRSHKQII